MRRLVHFCLIVLVLALAANSASAQYRSSTKSGIPSDRVLDRYGLKLAWWGQSILNPVTDRVRYVTLDEEIVVIQSELGTVTAFDHNSGRRLWASQYGRPNQPSFPIAMNSEVVAVPVSTRVYGVNKFNGRLLWELELEGDPSTGPSMDEAQMYIGTVDGTVFAYNLKKVRGSYEDGQDPKWSFLGVNWRYKAGKEINSPPVINAVSIAFSSKDGLLYSLAAEDHKLRFQVETDDPISAPLEMSDNLLFIATDAYKAYCVSAEGGGIIWEFVTAAPTHQAPRVVGEQLFLVNDFGKLNCIDKVSGVRLWGREHVSQFVAGTQNFVYVSDKSGDVAMLSRSNGTELGSLPLRGYPIRPSNDRTDRLIAVSPTGRVLCIHEQGRDYPTYHKFPDRRPILPEITPEEETPATSDSAEPAEGAEQSGAPAQAGGEAAQ